MFPPLEGVEALVFHGASEADPLAVADSVVEEVGPPGLGLND